MLNRAPTPLELGCSSPTNPCIIDNFLIADPPLKQVVATTYEAGLRGSTGTNAQTGLVSWALGTFYTLSRDDIINIAGSQPMTGYFQNAGNTLREGIEAKITISLGVAAAAPNTYDLRTLLSLADAALYQAKRDGRNRVVWATERQRKPLAA